MYLCTPLYAFHQADNLLTLVLYFTLFVSGAPGVVQARACDQWPGSTGGEQERGAERRASSGHTPGLWSLLPSLDIDDTPRNIMVSVVRADLCCLATLRHLPGVSPGLMWSGVITQNNWPHQTQHSIQTINSSIVRSRTLAGHQAEQQALCLAISWPEEQQVWHNTNNVPSITSTATKPLSQSNAIIYFNRRRLVTSLIKTAQHTDDNENTCRYLSRW